MEITEEEKIAEEFKKSSKNTMAEMFMGQIRMETPGREKKHMKTIGLVASLQASRIFPREQLRNLRLVLLDRTSMTAHSFLLPLLLTTNSPDSTESKALP